MAEGHEMEKYGKAESPVEIQAQNGKLVDLDTDMLEKMGYKPELNRSFSLLSVLAVGFSISNTWFGVTGALATGIANGGPVIYFWGLLGVAAIHFCVAFSLSELASAYPNAGGQYYWTGRLAPKRIARFCSYMTGAFSWAGAMFTGASVALVAGQGIVGLIILKKPDIVYQRWMGFVGFQIINALIFLLNCHDRFLPQISNASLYLSLGSMVVITITVLAASPTKQSAQFVFTELINDSGWSSNGIAFITGLIGVNWGFSCLDAATHMAEEIPRPEINIPKAVIGTVITGLLTTIPYDIALFFSVQDLDAVIATPTYVPSLELFRQATQSDNGAIVLQFLVILVACGCLFAIHTWQCRLAWSFSRDKGFPLSKYLSQVAPAPYNVPLWAHLWSSIWVGILGLLYLASSTAFNSLVTGCILLQYISYLIPVVLLMMKGRKIRHGPFWLGKWGWISNGGLVAWAIFTLIFYSFPYIIPATAGNMNYVSLVMAVFAVYAVGYWYIRARQDFVIPAGHATEISMTG